MTKTNMKAVLLAAVTFLLPLAPLKALAAADKTSLEVARLQRFGAGLAVSGANSESLRLWYVGTATEAVVTITSAVITAYAPAGTADSSNFGVSASSYQLYASAYDTMGELCDAIDALPYYGCELLGAKRSDNTNKLRKQTAASGTLDLKVTTPLNGGSPGGGARFKFDEEGASNVYNERLGLRPAAGKRLILRTCTGNANVIGTLTVAGKLAKYEGINDGVTRDDTTVVWNKITADDTDLQIPLDIPADGEWLRFARDAHVVVSAGNGSGVQAAANFLECSWQEE